MSITQLISTCISQVCQVWPDIVSKPIAHLLQEVLDLHIGHVGLRCSLQELLNLLLIVEPLRLRRYTSEGERAADAKMEGEKRRKNLTRG
jgi:hypothetical protein